MRQGVVGTPVGGRENEWAKAGACTAFLVVCAYACVHFGVSLYQRSDSGFCFINQGSRCLIKIYFNISYHNKDK